MGGVTNFLSTVEARSLGTADIDKITSALDKQTDALKGLSTSANRVSEHPGFDALAEKIKAGIENPLQAARSAMDSALGAIGPFGAGLAAAGGIFVTVGAAAFESAKALGEYGIQVRDIELRTGLASKEVGQFGFAAKAVGQDITIMDRLMRGLTMAVEDNTEKGEKARAWLSKWGVDVAGLKDGTASTAEALMKVGDGLERLPAGVARSAAAIDVFKRAGIEAIPFLVELNKNLATAHEQGFGPTEGDVARFTGYLNQVAQLETKWAGIKRQFQEGLVLEIKLIGDGIGIFTGGGGKYPSTTGEAPEQTTARKLALLNDIQNAHKAKGTWGNKNLTGVAALEAQRMQALEDVDPVVALSNQQDWGTKARLEQAQQYADQIRRIQQEQILVQELALEAQQKKKRADEAAAEAAKLNAAAAKKQAEHAHESLITLTGESSGIYLKAMSGGANATPQDKFLAVIAEIEARREEWFEKNPGISATDAKTTNFAFDKQRGAALLARNAEMSKALDGARVPGEYFPDQKQGAETLTHYLAELNAGIARLLKSGDDSYRQYPDIYGSADPLNEHFAGHLATAPGRSPEQALRDARDKAARGIGLYTASASLSGVSETDQVLTMQALKRKAADDEFNALMRIANVKNDEQLKQDAIDQQHQKYLDAEIEAQQALMQAALRQKEDFQSLAVGIFGSGLHGGSSRFLEQWGEQQLNKVVGNAAGLAWNDVSKAIPHTQGGFMGKLFAGTMFGDDPKKDMAAVKLSTAGGELSMSAAALMSAARAIALSGSGGGGEGRPGIFSAATNAFAGSDWNAPVDLSGGMSPFANMDWNAPANLSGGMSPEFWAGHGGDPGAGDGATSTAKYGRYGAAAVGTALGIYGVLKSPSVKGKLSSGGGALMSAGAAIPPPAGPIVMGVGAAMEIAAMAMGNPKEIRDQAETDMLRAAQYIAPTATTFTSDRYGRALDYDMSGNMRPMVQVTQNVYALDTQDFEDHAGKLADALSVAIESKISPRLHTNLRNVSGMRG